ncbi:MAG: MotA/TolQ/ExbB proton channel family protein [Bacteroidetes bacterium]|nr:MotA/TolQ/ExbB proton channel family protein [Bacteroidota bacterium]
MRGSFLSIAILICFVIGGVIYQWGLDRIGAHFVKEGGPLVIALIALLLLSLALVVERILSLKKAQGKESLSVFLRKVQQAVSAGDVDGAMALCDKQRGSLAAVIHAGLARYKSTEKMEDRKAAMDEVKQAIEESTLLEVPILERNLVALATIASIGTMVGLLGTVLGMIRAFTAFAGGGTPDAATLSRGISEALVNTAGGITIAIIAIVGYNYFTTKVDHYTYMIDEASQSVVDALATRKPGSPAPRVAASSVTTPAAPGAAAPLAGTSTMNPNQPR